MFRANVTGVSWVSDCSENPFKGALVLAPLKDCSGKRDGMGVGMRWGGMPAPPINDSCWWNIKKDNGLNIFF
ncbi:MAG: hypothetical protein ACK5IJ_02650 [Mangrovibacterium sp.]